MNQVAVVVIGLVLVMVQAAEYRRSPGRPSHAERSTAAPDRLSRDGYSSAAVKGVYQANDCPCYERPHKLSKLKIKLIAAVVIPLFLIVWLLGTILLNVATGAGRRRSFVAR